MVFSGVYKQPSGTMILGTSSPFGAQMRKMHMKRAARVRMLQQPNARKGLEEEWGEWDRGG